MVYTMDRIISVIPIITRKNYKFLPICITYIIFSVSHIQIRKYKTFKKNGRDFFEFYQKILARRLWVRFVWMENSSNQQQQPNNVYLFSPTQQASSPSGFAVSRVPNRPGPAGSTSPVQGYRRRRTGTYSLLSHRLFLRYRSYKCRRRSIGSPESPWQ
jgi:hypothetical protein